MEQLKREWKRCTRHQQPLTIMLLDIDHFKNVNDRYGHQQGDQCLIDIAQLLERSILRTGEFVARIGGEEFAVVLPNARNKSAIKLAEKLRNDISLLKFKYKKQTFNVSVSIGIACTTPAIGSDCEKLFVMADQALYQVKQEGRNNYRVASGTCQQTKDTME
jgi:diguanylate cyclase (GGDEF)-like protein